MGDLISRSTLKDFIVSAVDKQRGRGIDLLEVSEVIEVIENQPTAYDVEKVVAELEILKLDVPNIPYSKDVIDEAIGIVKRGGVE